MAGVDAFLAALDAQARDRFTDRAAIASTLDALHAAARAAVTEISVDAATFAAEAARRLGAAATLEQLAKLRADHLYLAIACTTGSDIAIRLCEAEIAGELETTAARVRARPDQVDEVRSHLRRVLFVSEPGRPAALSEYSGRGDLRSYVRVIAMRELVRVVNKGRKEVAVDDDALLDMMSPLDDPQLELLRDRYRVEVNAAMRAALQTLPDDARALLRYSLVDGWTVERIGALYGVHKATASRRVTAARELLATAMRAELASKLTISVDEVDSIVRLVQSRIDVSLERLLG